VSLPSLLCPRKDEVCTPYKIWLPPLTDSTLSSFLPLIFSFHFLSGHTDFFFFFFFPLVLSYVLRDARLTSRYFLCLRFSVSRRSVLSFLLYWFPWSRAFCFRPTFLLRFSRPLLEVQGMYAGLRSYWSLPVPFFFPPHLLFPPPFFSAFGFFFVFLFSIGPPPFFPLYECWSRLSSETFLVFFPPCFALSTLCVFFGSLFLPSPSFLACLLQLMPHSAMFLPFSLCTGRSRKGCCDFPSAFHVDFHPLPLHAFQALFRLVFFFFLNYHEQFFSSFIMTTPVLCFWLRFALLFWLVFPALSFLAM